MSSFIAFRWSTSVEETELDEEGNPVLDDDGNPVKKNVTQKTTLNNIIINGNGATLIGQPPMSNYYDGISTVLYADVYDGAKLGSSNIDVLPIFGADCLDAKKRIWYDYYA